MENKWLRFPHDVVDYDTLEGYTLLEKPIPSDEYIESYVDIRVDSIIALRPYTERDKPDEGVTGTIIYTTGEEFVVNVLPKEVRRLLNCEPTKVPSNKTE